MFLDGSGFQADLLNVLQIVAIAGSVIWAAGKFKTETALIRQTLTSHGRRFEHIVVENSEAFRKMCETLEKIATKVDRHHEDLIRLKERSKKSGNDAAADWGDEDTDEEP